MSLRRFASPTAGLVALLVATVAVYAHGLRGPFLMDDFDAIFPLLAAKAGGLDAWETLRQAPHHVRARVLSNLSFLLSYWSSAGAWPPSALAFKLGNLALHLGCATAIGLLGRALARRWGAETRHAAGIGLFAAALFALHPLLVSTVLYPVQRMAQLATLFSLLAVLAYVRWREALPGDTPRRRAWRIAVVVAFALLAVASKESGALVPLLIGVVELTAFRWPARDDPHRSAFDTGFGLLCAAPLVLGAVLFGLRWKTFLAGYAGRDFSLGERLLTQLHVLADYLGQVFWPRVASMGLYRDDFALTTRIDAATAALGALWGAALVAALLLRRRRPALAFGVLWFLAAHALESSVLPLELVFEHRNYLALFGPALALAWWAAQRRAPVAFAVAAIACFALGLQTVRRVADWSDYGRWIRAEVAHHPQSLRANTDLVVHLASQEDPDQAVAAVQAMRARFPRSAQPAIVALLLRCRYQSPLALGLAAQDLADLRQGQVGKDAFHAYAGLRQTKLAGGCEGLGWPLLAQVAEAVASNPQVVAYPRAAAAWQRQSAEAQVEAGNWRAVLAATERALAIEANDPGDWLRLMEARVRLGDAAGYAQARRGLLQLTGGQPGPFAARLAVLDEAVRRGTAADPKDPP